MAVVTNIYGKPEPKYEGCVFHTYERNGYHDSDWYAMCWDEGKQEVVTVNYDTTRCGGGGRADIDITDENLRKVYRFYKKGATAWFDGICNPQQAKMIRVGDTIRVIRGRKVRKGTIGKVFWKGACYNTYTYRYEDRIGIEVDGQKLFLPAEYAEVIGWESRLIRGKERKERIRQNAVSALPAQWQRYFDDIGRRWAS